ncbi:O-antigen translocase [Azohydromonas lata]|uniref:O-antigen translocase n=1 Tax=Azohydromonas lata TaxID=45677 RepID=A0ABU5IDF0_9BURK|nr:O-antigen translocase [Azohydromonas lata]MDZ5455988.1 O-antigen translocase [Azohydromonas lata]
MADSISSLPIDDSTSSSTASTGQRRAHGYRDILKSTALIGSATAINIGIGIIRTKAMAMLLGPAGYGVMGTFGQITDLARTVAQLGINSSGVRQIADAVASNDQRHIARTVHVLRFVSIACALIGAAGLAIFAKPIAALTFGSADHASAMWWLALAVFFGLITGGQGALLQGMRRIPEMAKLAVIGGLMGLVIGVPLVYFYGSTGIAPSLTASAACLALASWWYTRRIKLDRPAMKLVEILKESGTLFKLGLAFLVSGFLMQGAAYVVRIVILQHDGADAAGFYQAAWTLGGLYAGVVLQALGTDFYPRLVGVAHSNEECNRTINEQAQISLLLAIPGLVATISLAPLVITLFYSEAFHASVEILRWICIGMALRVFIYPVGYLVVARNKQVLFFLMDAAWCVANVLLTWWLVDWIGTMGAGLAYAASYGLHALLVYFAARKLSDFQWSRSTFRTACYGASTVTVAFFAVEILPPIWAYIVAIGVTMLCSIVSLRSLLELVSPQRQTGALRYLLKLGKVIS